MPKKVEKYKQFVENLGIEGSEFDKYELLEDIRDALCCG